MRRLALAVALAFVLSGVVRAGEISSTGVVVPPPPPPSTVLAAPGVMDSTGATAPGEIHPTGAPQESDTVLTIIMAIISIVS